MMPGRQRQEDAGDQSLSNIRVDTTNEFAGGPRAARKGLGREGKGYRQGRQEDGQGPEDDHGGRGGGQLLARRVAQWPELGG